MGTEVSLSFVCNEVALADTIATQTFATIHDYEQRFSRFLPQSELATLNRCGSGTVSREYLAILERSLQLVELTGGAFNPLIQVATLGYHTTYATLREQCASITPVQYDTDCRKILVDEAHQHVTLGTNQQLDFGGILKGYLANMLADQLTDTYQECMGSIINIGGDLATRGTDELHEPFMCMLYNPITGREVPVRVTDGSLATSGTYARRWQTNQGGRHHVIDGATQKNPTNSLVAASIIHYDGALAEALTKLFLTRGVMKAIHTVPPEQYSYQYFVVSETGETMSNIT